MSDFDLFWSHYPYKKGKIYAEKCFERAKKKGMPPVDTLIDAIHNQIKEKSYLKSQNKFCPEWKNPSTWLNQGCWQDECVLPDRAKPRQKTYTIDTIHRAYNILKNLGEDKFNSYCDQVGLSDQDREAILNKHKGLFDVSKLTSGIGGAG